MSLNTSNDDRVTCRDPLDVVAGKIIALWKKSDDQRTTAGLLLREAKERVEAGEDKRFVTFKAWCDEMLPNRSSRDIRRLLKRAYASDPAAEGERQRRASRESMATTRARRKADQRWSAAAGDDVLRAEEGGADRDAVGSTDTEFVPNGNDVGADFAQQLECWVALFEQSSDRIARLEKQYRLALLRRLQKALSLF